ncbi:MAG: ATP-dependent zinc metalloprotease FtsH [Parcubacteria group bacterium GW2011_GWA2_38_13]|nr:MAG: ATP-dependent zinc metalloprotease FtsH [Parcubacteria group bacterium GW2011_GWA2_38_13]
MKNLTKNILIVVVIFLTMSALFSLYSSPSKSYEETDMGTFINQLNNEQVESVTVRIDKLEVVLKDKKKELVNKEGADTFSNIIKNYGVDTEKIKNVKIDIRENEGAGFWISALLPFLLPFLIIAVFLYFMMRQVQGANSKAMSFGQSRAREVSPEEKKNKITFKDVAGVKEAKIELLEIVDFLKNPKKFIALGARIPKGVLLVGAPGTGKTLLARAVAGEAEVPFFNISGSEFVEMFVGVGASRVRDLFKKAKRSSPCIVFIDELDAVGRQRGAGMGGSNDEREQTLNQILVEMDGFDVNTNIIIMAATNRPDILDVALLRPGRFDRRVVLDMPDINDRLEILKVHSKYKPIDQNFDLRIIAERTPGFSGADLANLLNEAAILTARLDKKIIGKEEVLESIEKVLLGPERKSHILSEKEKKITAYHEAGHALVSHMLPNTDPVRKISIISRGRAAGYTLKLPETDKYMTARQEIVEELSVLLAGYVAEKVVFGDITTGASNDLKKATDITKNIITQFGMSEKLGPRTYGERHEMIFLGREITEQRDYSEKIAEQIDIEISKTIANAQNKAHEILTKERTMLDTIANLLLEKETLDREQFEALFAKKINKI